MLSKLVDQFAFGRCALAPPIVQSGNVAAMNVADNPFNSPIAPFEMLRVVRDNEIDELNHVNNVVYLAWINDVAVAHWNSLTSPELRSKLMWVALRHEIDYKAEALLGESIRVRTWTGVARGLRYARHTRIYRANDDALLAEGLTQWCPMDAIARKPARPPAEIAALFARPA
jgi:acyl-CoA thioester hydrolase